MIHNFHWIRPWWLLGLIPWGITWFFMLKQKSSIKAWKEVCDPHLFTYLTHTSHVSRRSGQLSCLLISILCMIIGLSGPAWRRLPVPVFQNRMPHVVLLDMSKDMFLQDLKPSRLERAKFILHDLFQAKSNGQFGMIAYTSIPFVVSPLTDDAETIDALLPSLNAQTMPVSGYQLSMALSAAKKLLNDSGYQQGNILILSTQTPSSEEIQQVHSLSNDGIQTSIIPIRHAWSMAYRDLAQAGNGFLIPLSESTQGIHRWLMSAKQPSSHQLRHTDDLPMWRDEGWWLLIPALILWLPGFRRLALESLYT